MRRFSILSLMGLVLTAAVAIAGLKGADDNRASAFQFFTLLLIGVSVLGVVHKKGKARAGWLGFGLFCGFYHLLAAGPWISDQTRPNLPTTRLLGYAYERINPNQSWIDDLEASGALNNVGTPQPSTNTTSGGVYFLTSGSNPQPLTIRASGLVGSGINSEPFQRVGHSLFALVLGLVGMLISRRMVEQENNQLSEPPEIG